MSGEKIDKVTYLNMAKEAILAEKSRNGTSKQVSRQLFFWVEVTNLLTYTPLLSLNFPNLMVVFKTS